jgi:hypothetical protein
VRSPPALAAAITLGLLVAACGGTGPTTSPIATPGGPTAEPTASPSIFQSSIYRYTIALPGGWYAAQSATKPWDGAGSPSHEGADVDEFGSANRIAWVYAAATTKSLGAFSADMTAADAIAHPCPPTEEITQAITVGGEPGRLTAKHCPAGSGTQVINVAVIHAGIGYFFYLQHPEAFPDADDDLVVFKALLTGVTFR